VGELVEAEADEGQHGAFGQAREQREGGGEAEGEAGNAAGGRGARARRGSMDGPGDGLREKRSGHSVSSSGAQPVHARELAAVERTALALHLAQPAAR
jgi:hypothetical protein